MKTSAQGSNMRRTLSLMMRARTRNGLIRTNLSSRMRRHQQFLSTLPYTVDPEEEENSSYASQVDKRVYSIGIVRDSTIKQPRLLRCETITIDLFAVRISMVADDGTSAAALYLPIPWLWINDPCNIQKGSGQKFQTPLSFFASKARIVQASIVPASTIIDPRVTEVPMGSLHSVGGMWKSNHPLKESSSRNADLLRVTWETRDSSFDSFYSLDWLLERRSAANTDNGKSRESPCLGSKTSPFTMGYNELFPDLDKVDKAASFQLLDAIFRDGAVLVQAASIPTKSDNDDLVSAVARVGQLLGGGRLSHGHLYGDVFHVEAVPDAINIAYTSVALAPHQDLAYYESPPGLQLLHCVENTLVTGGASTLIDGLAAANALRTVAPHIFQCLTETNATFIKQRERADMSYHRPHIRLDASGRKVVSVHWSPPFEGPLDQVLDEQCVQDYYVAHAAFQRMLDNALSSDRYLLQDVLPNDVEDQLIEYANVHTWEYQLQVGEMLIFNNQRMLHGRRSFTLDCPETSRRHLMGSYTNIDDTISEYRLLRREQAQQLRRRDDFSPVGNGSA